MLSLKDVHPDKCGQEEYRYEGDGSGAGGGGAYHDVDLAFVSVDRAAEAEAAGLDPMEWAARDEALLADIKREESGEVVPVMPFPDSPDRTAGDGSGGGNTAAAAAVSNHAANNEAEAQPPQEPKAASAKRVLAVQTTFGPRRASSFETDSSGPATPASSSGAGAGGGWDAASVADNGVASASSRRKAPPGVLEVPLHSPATVGAPSIRGSVLGSPDGQSPLPPHAYNDDGGATPKSVASFGTPRSVATKGRVGSGKKGKKKGGKGKTGKRKGGKGKRKARSSDVSVSELAGTPVGRGDHTSFFGAASVVRAAIGCRVCICSMTWCCNASVV